jgi:hypothetical protein
LLNPYQAISLLRSQIRLVPAARMRLWSNSSQDEGGELGVWLRVRTLKSAAFNLRTRVLGNQFQVIDLGKYTADRATKVAGSCRHPVFSVTLRGSVKGPIRTSPSFLIMTFHGSRLPSVPFGFNQLPVGAVLSRRQHGFKSPRGRQDFQVCGSRLCSGCGSFTQEQA